MREFSALGAIVGATQAAQTSRSDDIGYRIWIRHLASLSWGKEPPPGSKRLGPANRPGDNDGQGAAGGVVRSSKIAEVPSELDMDGPICLFATRIWGHLPLSCVGREGLR